MRFGNNPDYDFPRDMGNHDEVSEEDLLEADFRSRATSPDLTAAAEIARQREARIKIGRNELLKKLNNPSTYSLGREVMYHILATKEFAPDEIKMLNMANTQGRDTFMEFKAEGTSTHFIYVDKDYKNPVCTIEGDNRPSIPHPGATALLRVDWWNETIQEIHRWEDATEDKNEEE